MLTELTLKSCNKEFPSWEDKHENVFDAIKKAVVSSEHLTTINFALPEHKIFMMMDASNYQLGAVLLFRESWESA